MRKILIATLLISLLSGCTLWGEKTDFTSLYKSYITTQISRAHDLSQVLGYSRHEEVEGVLQAALEVPVLMSGAFATDYKIQVNNADMNAFLENMKMSFESPFSSGSLVAKKIGLTSIAGDLYILMDQFADIGVFPAEATAVFQKYNNTWLSYTQKDMQASLSGASPDELILSNISKNLSKMGIKDIEGYLTEYPIWKSTGNLGMSGSLAVFSIDLDRDAVVGLVKKATLDLAGSGLTADNEAILRSNLESLQFNGTLGFDPKDSTVMNMNVNVSQSGQMLGNIVIATSKQDTSLKLISINTASEILFTAKNQEKSTDLKLLLTSSGVELGQMNANITREGRDIRDITLDVTAQGVSVTFKNSLRSDGNFEGRLTLPVGAVSWNGKKTGKKLESFVLQGATPVGSVDIKLAPQGDMLRGPLVVKNGSDEILNADLGLRIDDGKFGIDVAVKNPEQGAAPTLKTSIDLTYKSRQFDDPILAPTSTTPLENLIKDLEALTPPEEDVFTEDTDLSDSELTPIESDNSGETNSLQQ